MSTATQKRSDLGVRTASALVMVAVAGVALWLGGLVWSIFAVAIMLGVLWEWRCLAAGITPSHAKRGLWNATGIVYVGFATWMLVSLRVRPDGALTVLLVVGAVIATDVGAYFAGRTFGGPKIAPKISPSKTWAGLIGGAVGSGLLLAAVSWAWPAGLCAAYYGIGGKPLPPGAFSFDDRCHLAVPPVSYLLMYVAYGAPVAMIAQAGDFFESWMKRRAGVKDSSHLIPGHGGLFDRLDGLLAVSFVLGIILLLSGGFEAIS